MEARRAVIIAIVLMDFSLLIFVGRISKFDVILRKNMHKKRFYD